MTQSVDVNDVLDDIETVLVFSKTRDITIEELDKLYPAIRVWNIQHGIITLKKIMSINGIEISHDFAVAVILHDMVKFKTRPNIVRAVMNKYLGEGNWTNVFYDHGYASGFLLMHILHPNIEDISFLFYHTDKNPWRLDPNKIPERDLAFYILDDITKGIKRYRFSMDESSYTVLKNFLAKPKVSDMVYVFNTLKRYKFSPENR